jgi:toxin-antitoxin system PIN domain toxin
MILTDVNVLVYAHRTDTTDHPAYLKWLEGVLNDDQAYGFSNLVLSGFLRVVTHPRVFNPPTDLASAFAFVQAIRDQPNSVPITPGLRHWEIFKSLCEATRSRGNLIPDAYLAAMAIESGSEWITTDRDYSRFPGLKWRHPLDG